jgi:hypothetical protein
MARRGRVSSTTAKEKAPKVERREFSYNEKLEMFKVKSIWEFNRLSDGVLEWQQKVGAGQSVQYSVEWSQRVVEAEFLASKWFAILRRESDEEMVEMARHIVDGLTEDMIRDRFTVRSTCLMNRAVGEYHREAASRLIEGLRGMLLDFEVAPVPAVELC